MISVCMIGKNEEKNICDCLSSIPNEFFEIIFVDTGSTDQTKRLVQKYTTKIYDFPWINDFSAARNFSIQKASNDWILILDCDEIITHISFPEIKTFLSSEETAVGIVFRNNLTEEQNSVNHSYEFIKRLFHRKYYHYEGPIHEQLVPILTNTKMNTSNIPLELLHTGYLGTIKERTEKAERNLLLLKKELEANPNSPYTLFQIGQSYYFIEEYKQAVTYFAKALSFDVDPNAQYVKILIISYGYALSYLEKIEDAIIICEEIYSYFENFADFIFLCGYLYMKIGPWEKAVENFIACIPLTDRISDVTTPAYYNLGCIYEVLGEKEKALTYFSKVPDFSDTSKHISLLKLK